MAEDGLTLRACFAFAGQFTGRHRNHDAVTASLAVLVRRVRLMGGIFSTLWSGDDGAVGSRCSFCSHIGRSCPLPRQLPFHKLVDWDAAAGRFAYDLAYARKQPDWTYPS